MREVWSACCFRRQGDRGPDKLAENLNDVSNRFEGRAIVRHPETSWVVKDKLDTVRFHFSAPKKTWDARPTEELKGIGRY